MKKLLSLILALVMAFSLVACGSSQSDESTDAEQEQQSDTAVDADTAEPADENPELTAAIKSVLDDKEAVNVIFWTGTGAANYPFLEEMVQNFMTEYPNITVELSNQGAIADLTEKLTQNIVSGTTPTISNLSPSTFPEYIDAGAIVDLAQFYNHETIGYSDEEKADFFQSYIDEAESFGGDGTLYGFPTNKKTANILAYNKTYFDQQGWSAPSTWDEVVTYAKAVFEDTGMPGFSYDTSYADDAFKNLSQQYGSAFIKDDGTIDIDNDGSRTALTFYKENMDAGYFTLPALMPSAGGNNSSNGFVNEECYMFVGASAGISYAVPKPDAAKVFEVGVAPVPQVAGGTPVYYSKGEDYCVFSNATLEEQVAAWILIKYMSDPANNLNWYINTGNLPIRQSTMDLPEYQAFLESGVEDAGYYKAQAVNAVLVIQDQMSYEKIADNASALSEACGTMWSSVMIGGADIETALATSVSSVG